LVRFAIATNRFLKALLYWFTYSSLS
jgi:hypothetical protein